jgi:hypothetical protein
VSAGLGVEIGGSLSTERNKETVRNPVFETVKLASQLRKIDQVIPHFDLAREEQL